jgi:hypothetical protein
MAFVPLCAELYLKHNAVSPDMRNKIVNAIPLLQLAMLFYVTCRENESSSTDDTEAYFTFRENSKKAFLEFCQTQKIVADDDLIQRCAAAIKTRGYSEQNWVSTLMTMSHDLDLPRCLSNDQFNWHRNQISNFVGANGMNQLKVVSEGFLLATGDRAWAVSSPDMFRKGYKGNLFVKCSTDVKYCAQAIASTQTK